MMDLVRFKRGQQHAQYFRLDPHFEGNTFFPHSVLVPLAFQTQASSTPLVYAGDFVHEGQLIARADNSTSVNVHAPVPGRVSELVETQYANGQAFRGMRICTGGRFDFLGKNRPPYPWKDGTQTQLVQFFDTAGLVATVNDTISLAQVIKNAQEKGIVTLTVVLYDKDPTCTLDSFLARQFTREVAVGIECIARSMNAKHIVIETRAEKKDKAIFDTIGSVITDRDIAHLVASQSYPTKTESIHLAEEHAVVIDAVTALSVYESVRCNQPMLTTYVLVTGKSIAGAAVTKVRIGTPVSHLIEEVGGLTGSNTHIITNGLLRGSLVDSIDFPVGKGIKSIHVVGKDVEIQTQLGECGHCGQCLRSCPAYIDPIGVVRHIQKKRYTAEVQHALSVCNGCACCSAVCPARIPLSAIIKSASQQGRCNAV